MLIHSNSFESPITGSPARTSPITPAVFNKKISSLVKDQRLSKHLVTSQHQLLGQDSICSFSPRIYDRVDQFLDQEGLDIVSPANIVRRRITTLKPVLRALGLGVQISAKKKVAIAESVAMEVAVPQFLLKRGILLEGTQNKTCAHAADCNKMKNKLFGYILPEVLDSSDDDGSVS